MSLTRVLSGFSFRSPGVGLGFSVYGLEVRDFGFGVWVLSGFLQRGFCMLRAWLGARGHTSHALDPFLTLKSGSSVSGSVRM